MIIMFQEWSGEYWDDEERISFKKKRELTLLDLIQIGLIKSKMKIKYMFKKGEKKKYIIYGNIRKRVLDNLSHKGYKLKRYTKPNGVFYYYIYF